MRLYYFTGPQYGANNIAFRRLKVSRFRDLNDPFELLAVDIGDRDHRGPIREARDRTNDTTGLICFSKGWFNPLLWGHYADRHAGVALGFEVPDAKVVAVRYAKKPMKVPVDSETGEPRLTERMIRELLRTKFHDWKYEDEMRYFVPLAGLERKGDMYFYPFSQDLELREVILGERCTLPMPDLRRMVVDFRPKVQVLKARIAFSSFNVVKNKVATRNGSRKR